jgi:hypothetical protein
MTGVRIPAEVVTAERLMQDRITELRQQGEAFGDGVGSFTDGQIQGITQAIALLFRAAIEAK